MAINSYQREIYKSHLEHSLKGQRAAHHKYLYIDANGRYVYPEDVVGKAKSTASNIGSMATSVGIAAKTKISNTIADQKQKLKDKKYLRDESRRKYPNLEKANVTSPSGKRVNQITSAHQEGTKKTTALNYQSTHDPISNKVVKVKRDFDANGNQIGVGYSTEPSHLAKKKHKISGIANSNQIEDRKRLEEQKRKEKKEINDKYGRLSLNGAALDRGEKSFQERRYAIAQENDHWKREQDAKRNYKTNKQRKSAHSGYEEDKRLFPEGGSTEELEKQKEKTAARKTKARTDATVEEMRKRKKRMDASVEPVKPTRNISGVKSSGKAPVKETPTPKKKRRSIDRDDLRTYKKAAGMMLDEGQQNEINRRKERSERVKAGNAKMRKEINSENAKKVGKALLSGSKFGKMAMAGRSISKAASERKAERQANEKQKEAEFNRKVKTDQAESNAKMKEASKMTAKNMAKNKGMQEVAKAVGKDMAKEVYNETYKELPEGYTIKADGYIYDDIGAVVRKATADDYKKKKVSKR